MTLELDLALDPVTHDLLIENGDLVLTSSIAQAVKIALLWVRGEWFVDLEEGVPYFERSEGEVAVFVKQPNLDLIASIFRSTIKSVAGVREITEFALDLLPNRKLKLTWAADSDEGLIGGEEVL